MPEFTTVSVTEAQVRTLSGRQRQYLNEYAGYIQQLSQGKAGKLHVWENEKPTTIRRRLTVVAQMLGIPLTIRRSENDIYFWSEGEAVAQPRPRRGGRRRTRQEETATPEQSFREARNGEQGEPGDSSHVEQHVSDAA
jgi:hypothetical protein